MVVRLDYRPVDGHQLFVIVLVSSAKAVLNASGKRHSANDRLAMCAMIGGKAVAHERNRTDGSMSTGDVLSGSRCQQLEYLCGSRVSQQGQRRSTPLCWRAQKTGPLDCSKLTDGCAPVCRRKTGRKSETRRLGKAAFGERQVRLGMIRNQTPA